MPFDAPTHPALVCVILVTACGTTCRHNQLDTSAPLCVILVTACGTTTISSTHPAPLCVIIVTACGTTCRYNQLDKVFPGTALKTVGKKLFVQQLIGATWINALFFGYNIFVLHHEEGMQRCSQPCCGFVCARHCLL